MTEDEMVGWHDWLNGHEFEQALGVGDRQGSLASMGLQRVRPDWATELMDEIETDSKTQRNTEICGYQGGRKEGKWIGSLGLADTYYYI